MYECEDCNAKQKEINRLRRLAINMEREAEQILMLANDFKAGIKKIRRTGRNGLHETWLGVFLELCCEHHGQDLVNKLTTAIKDINEDCEFYEGGKK